MDKENPDDFYKKGVVLYQSGQYEEVLQAFQKQIEIEPRHTEAYNNKGNALYKMGRHGEAIQAYDRQIEIVSGHAFAQFNRCLLLLERDVLASRRHEALPCLYALEHFHSKRLTPEYAGRIFRLLEAGKFAAPLFAWRLAVEYPFLDTLQYAPLLRAGMDELPPAFDPPKAFEGFASSSAPPSALRSKSKKLKKFARFWGKELEGFVRFWGDDVPLAYDLLEALDERAETGDLPEGLVPMMTVHYLALSTRQLLKYREERELLNDALTDDATRDDSPASLYYEGLCWEDWGDEEEARRRFRQAGEAGFLIALYAEARYLEGESYHQFLRTRLVPAEQKQRNAGKPWFLGIDFGKTEAFIEKGSDRSFYYYCNAREQFDEIDRAIDTVETMLQEDDPALADSKGTESLLRRSSVSDMTRAWQRRKGVLEHYQAEREKAREANLKALEARINAHLPGYVELKRGGEATASVNPDKIYHRLEAIQRPSVLEELPLEIFFWHWHRGDVDDDRLLRLTAYHLICKIGTQTNAGASSASARRSPVCPS